MKKAILFIVLALFMMNVSCGSSGSSDSSSSGSTAVSIRLGQAGSSSGSIAGAVSSSAIPSGITTIRVTVSANDMVTIIKEVSVAGLGSVTITLDIPNGPDRHILVEALNASGLVLYRGETIVDLGGEPLQLTIAMSSLSTCDLYVDTAGADESDCTDVNNPCRTITFALTQTAENMNICVAAGTYNIDGGESFPLNMVARMTLTCTGTNHSTIIDSTVIDGSSPDTIIGAAGASIEGCTVRTGDNSVAISDNGTAITVNDCSILGVGIEGGAFDSTGINLTADSTVSNSTITNFVQGEGGGEGIQVSSGNPTIAGNSITGNDYGVRIFGGSPVVSGNNTLSCNNQIDLENVSNGDIDARNNIWDSAPPTASSYPDGCPFGVDVCNSDVDMGSVDVSGSTQASSPCPLLL